MLNFDDYENKRMTYFYNLNDQQEILSFFKNPQNKTNKIIYLSYDVIKFLYQKYEKNIFDLNDYILILDEVH